MLFIAEAAGLDWIGQVAGETVVAHQASYFFNQIHLALEVHGARGGHLHLPALVIGAEAAAQGGEDLLDLGVG